MKNSFIIFPATVLNTSYLFLFYISWKQLRSFRFQNTFINNYRAGNKGIFFNWVNPTKNNDKFRVKLKKKNSQIEQALYQSKIGINCRLFNPLKTVTALGEFLFSIAHSLRTHLSQIIESSQSSSRKSEPYQLDVSEDGV